MKYSSTISSKGQVTVPQEIRNRPPQFVTLHFELGNVRQAFLLRLVR